ncbi:MAG: DUF4382 domain-containing protein [Pseudomonadota bacterium]|nr:DUF4382 domain-containing protein [Pseudomonadota bacterium]
MKFKTNTNLTPTISVLALASLLTACGGGGGGSSTGTLNLGLTDASADKAKAVVVEFAGVQLQSAGGDRIDHDFFDEVTGDPAPRQIDLLALTGGTTETLLDGVTLNAGRYNWIRLKVNAERGVIDSYIDLLDGTRHSLYIPSGAETGLKLNRGFDVPEDGMASFTIDFDLRKSVHYPSGLDGDRILRPTMRLVDDNTAGALAGTVASEIIADDPDDCSGVDYVGAVYVFNKGDTVDDVDGTGDPVTSAKVSNDGNYAYSVAFLPEGDYLIAFTCDADIDDPIKDADTDLSDGPVNFIGKTPVTITAGKTTVHSF